MDPAAVVAFSALGLKSRMSCAEDTVDRSLEVVPGNVV